LSRKLIYIDTFYEQLLQSCGA